MEYIYGIDIGGTTCKIGIFQSSGELLDKWEIETDKSSNGKNIIKNIASSIDEYNKKNNINKNDIIGYGFGVPGSTKNNVVNKCINIGWGTVDVKKECLKYIDNDLIVCNNDANVAALGEIWQGNAKNIDHAIMYTLGTGVGGGVIVENKVVEGANGAGGEIGHMHVDDYFNFPCNCGNHGCLETVASATGIVKMAKYFIERRMYKTDLVDDANLTCKMIYDYAKKGDELALVVTEYVAKYMGIATAAAAGCIDPLVFIIGGGVSKAGNILIDGIRKYYKKYAFHPSKDTPFVLAKLGNDAGIYGAAYLVKLNYKK